MTLNEKLARLRKREGLSQAQVAEILDVSRQAVTKWETGTSRPSTENLQSLSKLYNVSLEDLLDEREEEKLPVAAPLASNIEPGAGQKKQKDAKPYIRWPIIPIISVVVFVLVICFLFWYGSRQTNNGLDLHSIQGENTTLSDEPDFNLSWE